MAKLNFGGTEENVIMREEFPRSNCRTKIPRSIL